MKRTPGKNLQEHDSCSSDSLKSPQSDSFVTPPDTASSAFSPATKDAEVDANILQECDSGSQLSLERHSPSLLHESASTSLVALNDVQTMTLLKFQRTFPMFHSFLARYRPNPGSMYYMGLVSNHANINDSIVANNGLLIMCVGLRRDHDNNNVPHFFETMYVELVNELNCEGRSFFLHEFLLRPILRTDERRFSLGHLMASTLFNELPDCFCVCPMLQGDNIVLLAYVLHVDFRHYRLDAFPESLTLGSETVSILYKNEFICRASLCHQSPSQPDSSTRVLRNGTYLRLNEKYVATLGSIVVRNSQHHLLTNAHVLADLLVPSADLAVALYDTPLSSIELQCEEDGKLKLIKSDQASESLPIVRFGNFVLPESDTSVYLDVLLLPLNCFLSATYQPLVVGTDKD
ncbi:hypothetical protein RCL1_006910 [Eukaryota sp. TZLM3-RCL]